MICSKLVSTLYSLDKGIFNSSKNVLKEADLLKEKHEELLNKSKHT